MNTETIHFWMKEALKVAAKAMDCNEVPVGGLFVREREGQYEIVKKAHNLTTKTKNATQHS